MNARWSIVLIVVVLAVMGGVALVGVPAILDANSARLRAAAAATPTPDATLFEVTVVADPGSTDPHIAFSGGCQVSELDQSTQSKSLQGTTPAKFTYSARALSCSFQKQDANRSLLRTVVTRGGVYQKQVDTNAEFGIVSFSIP